MKTKELFKKIEAANFIANNTPAGLRVCITCDFIDIKNGCIALPVSNANGKSNFNTWNEFAACIADEYTNDVCELIAKCALRYNREGRYFEIRNGNEYALEFRVWNN